MYKSFCQRNAKFDSRIIKMQKRDQILVSKMKTLLFYSSNIRPSIFAVKTLYHRTRRRNDRHAWKLGWLTTEANNNFFVNKPFSSTKCDRRPPLSSSLQKQNPRNGGIFINKMLFGVCLMKNVWYTANRACASQNCKQKLTGLLLIELIFSWTRTT